MSVLVTNTGILRGPRRLLKGYTGGLGASGETAWAERWDQDTGMAASQ